MTYTEYQTRHAELDRLDKLARENNHSCGAGLTVAIRDAMSVLRCGKCNHFVGEDELVRRRSLTRQYKDGDTLPLVIVNRIERRLGGKYMQSTELTTMSQEKMLARVEQAKFPQELKKEEKALLALAARTYGFDPIMGELTIFQGRPYVSIDGRYRKAQESGKLNGVSTRPATKQEKEEWSIPMEDYFFRAEVQVKGAAYPFVGWGRVRGSETQGKGYKPIETNPQRMAEKRAEAQALRKAFSIPLPSAEDIGLEEEPAFEVEVVKPVQLSEAAEDMPSGDTSHTQGEENVGQGRIDPDPLASWTGTSRPKETTEKAPENVETTNRTPHGEQTPPAMAKGAGQVVKATEEQLNLLRDLLADNYQRFHVEIQKRHHCYPSEMTTELAATYIQQIEKKKEAKV